MLTNTRSDPIVYSDGVENNLDDGHHRIHRFVVSRKVVVQKVKSNRPEHYPRIKSWVEKRLYSLVFS